MVIVAELFDAYPIDDTAPREIVRDKELHFTKAQVGPVRPIAKSTKINSVWVLNEAFSMVCWKKASPLTRYG